MSSHDAGRRRRDSSPRRESRRDSPGSRSSSPPDMGLPAQFGRIPDESIEDESNVLQRMKVFPSSSPLRTLYKCLTGPYQLKVWTRNFKEVRGICTGSVIAFDKHWNLIMSDVEEVYLKPRKGKTPFMEEPSGDSIPDLPPKVPKVKKPVPEVEKPAVSAEECQNTEDKKKKKRKKKKTSPTSHQRKLKFIFIRGDNVVMLQVVDADTSATTED